MDCTQPRGLLPELSPREVALHRRQALLRSQIGQLLRRDSHPLGRRRYRLHPPWVCTDARPLLAGTCLHVAPRRSPPRNNRPRSSRPLPASGLRPRQSPCSVSPVSTPPTGRHSGGCGQTAHGSGDPATAWPPRTAGVGVVALCPQAQACRGIWDRTCRPCPRAYPLHRPYHRRDPPLPPRCSPWRSQVLLSPRTPAAQRPISPSVYTGHLAATTAAQTGLSSSAPILPRVLLPLPRRDPPRFLLRPSARRTWPSRRHDPLGSLVVNLTRLQDSLHVAARVLAPSVEALDAPLGTRGSLPAPGACYPALRCLPGRDSHPLDRCSPKALAHVGHGHSLEDAPCLWILSAALESRGA